MSEIERGTPRHLCTVGVVFAQTLGMAALCYVAIGFVVLLAASGLDSLFALVGAG